jgi:hypothetical protein
MLDVLTLLEKVSHEYEGTCCGMKECDISDGLATKKKY